MAVLLPEPESPVTTTRRSSVIRFWGPVRCSRGFRRAPLLRCPQTPSAKTSASALGLPPFLSLPYSRALLPRHTLSHPLTLSPSHSLTLSLPHSSLPHSSLPQSSLRLSGAAALAGGDLVVE